jgi:tRNA dimethylallyltransferase
MTAPHLSKTVVAIFGPTASGKTEVAEALAAEIPVGIVSADSMQLYRGLPVLTNQPELPCALVGVWPLDHEGSVAEFQHRAHEAIDRLLMAGRTPIVVGGTGLYLRAALADFDLPPAPDPGARERWERVYDRLGPTRAHAILAERDPRAARSLHAKDRRRVVRALELYESGESLAPPRSRLWAPETRHPTRIFGLALPREVLDERIRARTEAMFARGVEKEVASAHRGRLSKTADQIIGLREVAELPRDEAVAAIALRTRQFAAYQRKWMRRIPGLVSIDADREPAAVASDILTVLRA